MTDKNVHRWTVSNIFLFIYFSQIDVEAELTTFAYYYVGIACAVIVFGYFQVLTKKSYLKH